MNYKFMATYTTLIGVGIGVTVYGWSAAVLTL